MKFYLYNLAPIIFHLLCLPFWLIDIDVSLAELLIGAIILPVYLIIVNYKYIQKMKIRKFITLLLATNCILVIGVLIGYCNWGIATGHIFNPDSETVYICNCQAYLAVFINTVGLIISYIIKLVGNKK